MEVVSRWQRRWGACLRSFVVLLSGGLLHGGDLVWESTRIEKQAPKGEKKIEAVFLFKNSSAEPVEILSVSTSCGCTTAALSRKTYQAGESGELKATFIPGARRGRQEKSILVKTANSQDVLLLCADIPDVVEIDKKKLAWSVGGPAGSQFFQVSVREKLAKVVSVKSSSAGFQAVLVETEPQKSYRIEVRPATTERALDRVIRLEMETPEPRTIFLPVSIGMER